MGGVIENMSSVGKNLGGALVSIIIPVYNGSNYLREAIESALDQTYKNIEVVVVNDGSSDDGETQKIIDAYGSAVHGISKANGGVASALNAGISNMRGEYFFWLSHDDLLKPDALEIYMAQLSGMNKTTLLYGSYDLIDEHSVAYNIIDFSKKYTKAQLENSVYPVLLGCVNACTLLIHKSHFQRVGLYNENLRITQDNEMNFRLFRHQKPVYINRLISSKRYHREQDSRTKDVYPDEDRFICECLEQLEVKEYCSFTGDAGGFFREMLERVSDGRHPFSEEYCKAMIIELEKGTEYEKLDRDELQKLLVQSNRAYLELKSKYEELQKKYVSCMLRG